MKIPKTIAPPTAAPITVPLTFPLVLAFLLPGASITSDLEDASAAKDDWDKQKDYLTSRTFKLLITDREVLIGKSKTETLQYYWVYKWCQYGKAKISVFFMKT